MAGAGPLLLLESARRFLLVRGADRVLLWTLLMLLVYRFLLVLRLALDLIVQLYVALLQDLLLVCQCVLSEHVVHDLMVGISAARLLLAPCNDVLLVGLLGLGVAQFRQS